LPSMVSLDNQRERCNCLHKRGLGWSGTPCLARHTEILDADTVSGNNYVFRRLRSDASVSRAVDQKDGLQQYVSPIGTVLPVRQFFG
jgi:hypothetical protein